MKKTILTIVKTGATDGNGDEFPEIAAIGYDEEDAKYKALSALRYACCKDFGHPGFCSPGVRVEYFKAEGYLLEDGDDVSDLEEEEEFVSIFKFENKQYALLGTYWEYYACDGGDTTSDQVRKCENWDEALNLF